MFNEIHYLQKTGCAIGPICAPSYANIFMGNLINFQTFTTDLSMIYSFFGMKP